MNSAVGAGCNQPLVSVLTPVYNGERYLAESIESVLGQTYQNWEYVIVNNCSTDRTLEIASDYAGRDPRIRIVNNSEFVGAIRNHNIALRHISPDSKYCKFVCADDLLFPACLTEMVRVAEAHPSVGIVSSYQLLGHWVHFDGLPYPSTVIPGREAIRPYFLQCRHIFNTTSGFMLRADLVRNRDPFLNEKYLFADDEIYFVLLQHHDYGFVHQVLSMWRIQDEALSAFTTRHNQWSIENLYLTKQYGPIYLTPEEYSQCLKQSLDRYYRCQGHELFHFREKSFWKYHRTMMQQLGFSLNPLGLLKGAMMESANIIFEPFRAASRQFGYLIGRRPTLRAKVQDKR